MRTTITVKGYRSIKYTYNDMCFSFDTARLNESRIFILAIGDINVPALPRYKYII